MSANNEQGPKYPSLIIAQETDSVDNQVNNVMVSKDPFSEALHRHHILEEVEVKVEEDSDIEDKIRTDRPLFTLKSVVELSDI